MIARFRVFYRNVIECGFQMYFRTADFLHLQITTKVTEKEYRWNFLNSKLLIALCASWKVKAKQRIRSFADLLLAQFLINQNTTSNSFHI